MKGGEEEINTGNNTRSRKGGNEELNKGNRSRKGGGKAIEYTSALTAAWNARGSQI